MSETVRLAPEGPQLTQLQERFSQVLPFFRERLQCYLRYVRCPATADDLACEALALAWKWCVSKAADGKDLTRRPASLIHYAARAALSGRRIAGGERAREVLDRLAQQRHGFRVVSCDRPRPGLATLLNEVLAAGPQWSPAEQAAFRIDFPAWVSTLTPGQQTAVEVLAWGVTTTEAARELGVSPPRVSQLRRELLESWTDV